MILAVLGAWWFTRPPAASSVTARMAPLVRTLQFSARVATASRVEVGSTLTGRVREVRVTDGAQVQAGDVLLTLENEELQAALAQSQANERQASARLAGLRSTGRRAAEAAQAQAESVFVAAEAELQRSQELVARGFLSEARLDEARRALAVARAQRDAARAQRAANAEQGTEVAQAQAQLALARAARTAAESRLGEAVLTAPADARVLDRMAEPGQIVQPGRALVALALSGPLQLVAQVDERYLGQLQPGQPAGAVADAYPAERIEARVLSIAPIIDAARGAIEVKFALPEGVPPFLREDMTVSVEVETARRAQAWVLPVDALREDADGTDRTGGTSTSASTSATVWLERDGRVEARQVRTGLRTLDQVEVVGGLAEGEQVLIGAVPPPGNRVRVERASPDPGSPAAR